MKTNKLLYNKIAKTEYGKLYQDLSEDEKDFVNDAVASKISEQLMY